MAKQPRYTYKATVLKISDGDSIKLSVDLGFHVAIVMQVRLLGLDAAEISSPHPANRKLAQRAKKRLAELLVNPQVTIRSEKPYKSDLYGRWLAEVFNSSGVNVNQTLLDEKLAVPYDGGKRDESEILD